MPASLPLPAPKNPAAAGAMLRALLGQQPTAQPDPQDSLTKYLLALNATLAELRADDEFLSREIENAFRKDVELTHENKSVMTSRRNATQDTRREVYAEIARVVGEDPLVELRVETKKDDNLGKLDAQLSDEAAMARQKDSTLRGP